jgi:hypothetical protein
VSADWSDVYDEVRAEVADYYRRQRALARRAGFEHALLADLDRHTPTQARALREHGVQQWAALYGCSPVTIDALGVITTHGTPRAGLIEAPRTDRPASVPPGGERVPEHHLTPGWDAGMLAVDRLGCDLRVLNRELRGTSRALWLATLWAGRSPGLLRARWYSPSDVGPYWPAAWLCCEWPDLRGALIEYGRALVWRYAELSPRGHTHAAHATIESAARMTGAVCAEEAA